MRRLRCDARDGDCSDSIVGTPIHYHTIPNTRTVDPKKGVWSIQTCRHARLQEMVRAPQVSSVVRYQRAHCLAHSSEDRVLTTPRYDTDHTQLS